MNYKQILWRLSMVVLLVCSTVSGSAMGESVYTQKPNDSEALFFTPEAFNIKADGIMDVSDQLQAAINKVKTDKNFGILFIPEGKYRISRTIHVPGAVRLIGYGKNRPEIILGKNTPGFQNPIPGARAEANFMIWFTGGIPREGATPSDAGAGTFYSAVSNVNFRIEDGNPNAVALRTHFAQHGFVSFVDIYAGNGLAGLVDVGNEMESVRFFGGQYGILTSSTSPGWQMMMVDTYFEGQKKAAINTRIGGLVIVNMHVKNTPIAIEIAEGVHDHLYVENSIFENISQAGIVISKKDNSFNQVNVLNVDCKNVPVFVKYRFDNTTLSVADKMYKVKDYCYGLQMKDMADNSQYRTTSDIAPLKVFPKALVKDIPSLPSMDTWVNVKDLGAKGDGVTDDTKAIQDAINKHMNVYVPQGWYIISETLKLRPDSKVIGLHPFATQFILPESTSAFSGFGAPVAMVESSKGGNDIFNGIGINTGAINYRAVGVKWMAGAGSLLNDVKFVGGHGTMSKPRPRTETTAARPTQPQVRPSTVSSPSAPLYARGKDLAWDNQYWSLWVTDNGGGTIKDIWTASTYAANGLYVNNTSTPSRIYAMSLEHHVRSEARFDNVSNWRMYAFQTEEETVEGSECQPIDIFNCKDLDFINTYMYRVIKVTNPYFAAIRTWNSENIKFYGIHHYSQIKQVTDYAVYDVKSGRHLDPWEIARVTVTGKEESKEVLKNAVGQPQLLATGLDFAEGLAVDSKGNAYFSDFKFRRVFKWDAAKQVATMMSEYPWKPLALGVDTKDNLLVVFRYDPQPGLMINGKPDAYTRLPDDNGNYSGWGNGGWDALVYSIDPSNPDATIAPLKKVAAADVKNVAKALYPANRWRGSDFEEKMAFVPKNYFVAPDGVTYIPEIYDLSRTSSLSEAFPGKPFYTSNDGGKYIGKADVAANGALKNISTFANRGQYGVAQDKEGNVYVADGKVYVYDKTGREINAYDMPERPLSLQVGANNTLFVTTTHSLYSIKLK